MRFHSISVVAYLCLLSGNQLDAFSSFQTASKVKMERLDLALFMSFGSNGFSSPGNNFGSNNQNNNNFGSSPFGSNNQENNSNGFGPNAQNNNNNGNNFGNNAFGSNNNNNNESNNNGFGPGSQNNNFGGNNQFGSKGLASDQTENFGAEGFSNPNAFGTEPPREKQFRMVKQFNGDYKAVPYFSDDDPGQNPAAESEIRRIEQMYRRQPPLTSPARALMDKQWDWQRPEDRPRYQFRQVKTFSGDMKTVPYDAYDPAFDHRVTNSEFGRVDGTNYVPPLAPEDRRGAPMMPPPRPPLRQRGSYPQNSAYEQRRPPFRQGPTYPQNPPRSPAYQDMPPPPPPYDQNFGPPPPPRQPRMSPARRREMERYEAKMVGDEFRREMRKYRQDDYGYEPEYDFEEGYERNYDRSKPLENLAKGTEKFLKQITGLGRSQYRPKNPRRKYRIAPPERREVNSDWIENSNYRPAYPNSNYRPANEFESRSGSFNSSPAVRSFEEQSPIPPPPQYYGTNRGPTYYERGSPKGELPSASRAVRSFNQDQRPDTRSYGPRYRMERQFNGDYKSVPVYDDEYNNFYSGSDNYNNPAADSEIGRTW